MRPKFVIAPMFMRYGSRSLFAALCFLGLLLPVAPLWAEEAETATPTAPQAEWLEPRGLSVIDLVGLVPEEHLRDTIVSWHVGGGLLQYISGQRTGNTVTVNVRVYPRYWTDGNSSASIFSCLGKPSLADEWTSTVGSAKMRVYDNGTDVTGQVGRTMDYVPAGQVLPGTGTQGWWRYDFLWGQRTIFTNDGAVEVPANMGCKFTISGRRTNLTAQFVVESTNYLSIEELGNQNFTFRSYIGVGNAGHLGSLNTQMVRRFGDRHDKFQLSPPSGAEYVLVKYPPTPVDPYMGQPEINVDQPASGSYRFVASGNVLSVDHVHSMALPLYGQWQDADQSGGAYLSFFRNATRIAVPEYFVPAGIPYNACMVNGGCPSTLLDQIYNTPMNMTVYYYKINRIAEGLTKLPIKQVGPSWRPGAAMAALETGRADQPVEGSRSIQGEEDRLLYLPFVKTAEAPPQILDDGDRNGCPCGWFDGYGRMLDYVPGP
ncbi:MAG: hypothetical protein KF832_03590 [Caldilineaceae bacterium]|nr:hypothetical protein [Caldilineaceae bacterium]